MKNFKCQLKINQKLAKNLKCENRQNFNLLKFPRDAGL